MKCTTVYPPAPERPIILETLKDAFATAFKKPLTWVALVAIPALVLCFALLYYDTFIDPFARMKELPVAVINQDAGTTFDGEERNFGQELEDSLLDNDKAGWTAEEPPLLDEGLENSDYFLAVVIPNDFSERVAAGETKGPSRRRSNSSRMSARTRCSPRSPQAWKTS